MNYPNQSESIGNRQNQFTQTAVSPETENEHCRWNSVLQYLQNNQKNVLERHCAPIFCDFLIEGLEKRASKDAAVSSAIIDIITILFLEHDNRETHEIMNIADPYEYFFRSKREDHLALSILYWSNKCKESIFPDRENIQIVNALKIGNHRLMQVLATNGYNGKISDDSFFARKVAANMIENFLWTFAKQYHLLYGPEPNSATTLLNSIEDPNVHPHLIFHDLVHFRDNPLWRPKTVSFKRLFLLIFGIYALSLKSDNNPEFSNFVKCLDIYLRTISEPYLAVIEVRSLLSGEDFIRPRKEYLVDEWCKVFENTMPFCTRNYEPRRLSHLARCQVRQNLCNSGSSSTLPAILDEMIIPKKIADFLLCKPSEKETRCF